MDNNAVIGVFNNMMFNSDTSSSSDDEVFEIFRGPVVKRPRVQNFVQDTVDNYSEEEFRQHFRMFRPTFNHILGQIADRLENRNSIGRPSVLAKEQFLIALWYFATPDCYRSICSRFDVGKATAHRIVRKVTNVLLDLAPTVIKWPNGNYSDQVRNSFTEMGFPNVKGVIDGKYIKIRQPREHGINYICRKNFPAIILQAVCDHRMLFTHCYAGEVGAIHDAQVLRRSELWAHLISNNNVMFEDDCHLIGDKAYPCITRLMTPFRNNGHLTARQQHYNYRLSSVRNIIERSFALLTKRFRALKDTFDIQRIDWIPNMVIACCVLHNICILQNDILHIEPGDFLAEDDAGQQLYNVHDVNDRQRYLQGNLKRNYICNNI